MSSGPSFERVDYSLRTNKNIERKLIFERLSALTSIVPFRDYRYMGFGSLWFVDFVMAHRMLGVTQLCSIEREANAGRAEFNKPYFCIDVRPGDSSRVLADMPPDEWNRQPQIVWLDYDGRFDEDARNDCRLVLERGKVGTVLIATANAHRGSYRRGSAEASPPVVKVLRELLGDAVPTELPGGRADVGEADFSEFLAKSISNYMGTVVRTSGRHTDEMPDRFVPLFEYVHRDNVPMVTVGGIVAPWRMLELLEKHFKSRATQLFQGAVADRETLDLVPITIKEKLALDSLLPCNEGEIQGRADAKGIKLPIEQVLKYRRLYPHFPLFGEMGF